MRKPFRYANTATNKAYQTNIFFLKPQHEDATQRLNLYLKNKQYKIIELPDDKFMIHRVYQIHKQVMMEFIQAEHIGCNYIIFRQQRTKGVLARAEKEIKFEFK